jgi:hypothetical protein
MHIRKAIEVQAGLELVLSAAPASVESQMGWGGVDMGAAGARAAAKAERELNTLMFDVAGRIAAIATAQRAWLVSAPPLQKALHTFRKYTSRKLLDPSSALDGALFLRAACLRQYTSDLPVVDRGLC